MQNVAHIPVAHKSGRWFWLALVLGLCFCALCTPAHADNPFDMEPSSWMSFERYKEKPANWVTPEQRQQAAVEPVVVPPPIVPAEMQKITAPTRAITAPVMPALNKDLGVHISTTADDHPMSEYLNNRSDVTPGSDLDKQQWKDAVEAARKSKDPLQSIADEGASPLALRFATLPLLTTIKPEKKAPETVLAKKPEPAPPTEVAKAAVPVMVAPPPADPAACAAIEAYKKRQLAAIESDRKTLAALQAAISELGLEKQLDFMTGANGSLQATGAAALETPVPATP